MTPQDIASAPDVLTIAQLQKLLNIGRSTAYRLVGSREIASIRIGRSIRIPKKYVVIFLENKRSLIENQEEKCYNGNVTADNKGLPEKVR